MKFTKLSMVLLLSSCYITMSWGQNDIAKNIEYVGSVVDSLPQQSVGGLSVDKLGYLYSADFGERIYKINPYTKEVRIFADGLYGTSGNCFDAQGNLYQANIDGNYISKIDRNGSKTVFADSLLYGPVGIAVNSSGDFFSCNCHDNSISKISPQGATEVFVKSSFFHCPNGITIDPDDNLYIVSFNNNDIIKITPNGIVTHFAKTPDKIGNGHIAIANNKFYVTGFHGHRVYKLSLDGKNEGVIGVGVKGSLDGGATQAKFSYPNGIASSPDGRTLYVNEMHGALENPVIMPGRGSVREIKLTSIADKIKEKITQDGIEGIQAYYKQLKDEKFNAEDTSNAINSLAHNYMITGYNKEAEIIFKMNIESYPNKVSSYMYLARNMYLMDEIDQARKYYLKAQELIPDSEVIKFRLQNLK